MIYATSFFFAIHLSAFRTYLCAIHIAVSMSFVMISFGRRLDNLMGGEDEKLNVSFGNKIQAYFYMQRWEYDGWILASIHWTWTIINQIKYMYNLNELVKRVCLQIIGVSKMRDGKAPLQLPYPNVSKVSKVEKQPQRLFLFSHQCFSPSFIPMPAGPTALFVIRILGPPSMRTEKTNCSTLSFRESSSLSFFQSPIIPPITHSLLIDPYPHHQSAPKPIS